MGGKFGKFALFLFDIFLKLKHYNIGPYNDLYYIFVLSKRPTRIWKQPMVLSMISYRNKTWVVLQYFETTYTLFKENYT
jgi:hypothetical protein